MDIDNIDVPAETEQQALPVVSGKSKLFIYTIFSFYFLKNKIFKNFFQ